MKTFNFSDRRLNKEEQEAFIHGYESMLSDVASMGWAGARELFNWSNDNIKVYSSLGRAFTSGGMEALMDSQ